MSSFDFSTSACFVCWFGVNMGDTGIVTEEFLYYEMQESHSIPPKAVQTSLYDHGTVRVACSTYILQPQLLFASVTNGLADSPTHLLKNKFA